MIELRKGRFEDSNSMLGEGIFFCGGTCSGVVFDWYGEIGGYKEIELWSSNFRVILREKFVSRVIWVVVFGKEGQRSDDFHGRSNNKPVRGINLVEC